MNKPACRRTTRRYTEIEKPLNRKPPENTSTDAHHDPHYRGSARMRPPGGLIQETGLIRDFQ